MTQVVRLDHDLPESFAALEATAHGEGYDFLARLARNWRDSAYLGDADASVFGVFGLGDLVAIGAQTADWYDPSPEHRRLRHFYVHPDARRSGIGTTLAGTLIQEAFQLAPRLHLRATHDVSRAFWDSLGFERVDRPDRSHRLVRA